MKTKIKNYLMMSGLIFEMFIGFTSVAQPSVNEDTNHYPIRQLSNCAISGVDSSIINQEDNYFLFNILLSKQIQPETLPAKLDPNGNWGALAGNLQLSLRFRYSEFLSNEPVWVVATLRNLEGQKQAIKIDPYSYRIILFGEKNTNNYHMDRPPRNQLGDIGSVTYFDSLASKSSGFFPVNLSHFFDLKQSGKYSVQLELFQSGSTNAQWTNLISGRAEFEIVPALSPASVKVRTDYEQKIKIIKQYLHDLANQSETNRNH